MQGAIEPTKKKPSHIARVFYGKPGDKAPRYNSAILERIRYHLDLIGSKI